MNTRKVLLAVVVNYIFLAVSNYLINAIWLLPVYRQHAEAFRPLDELVGKMWVMWLAQLLFAFLFVYIYTRGVEEKPWVWQGLRYAVLMALLVVAPSALAQHVVYRVPYSLAIEWITAGCVQFGVMGLVTAAFCRKEKPV